MPDNLASGWIKNASIVGTNKVAGKYKIYILIITAVFMDIDKIQEMFSEIGLGSSEQRDKMVKELSINIVDSYFDQYVEIKTISNTLNNEHYA